MLGEVVAAVGGQRLTGSAEVGIGGVSIDSRTLSPGELFVAVVGARFDGHDFVAAAAGRGAAAALVDRAIEAPAGLPLVQVADTTRALGELAGHARRQSAAPVVAITGSVGKTTTKDMAAALLGSLGPVLKTEGNLNNQYGLPLTLLRLRPEHRAAVLELGMSAAGELRRLAQIAQPDVAVITRVAPVHLEFFESVEAIAAAKAEILTGLRPGGAAVLNADDPRLRLIGQRHAGRVIWFGRDRRCEVSAENWRGTAFGMRFDLRVAGRSVDVALPLPGPHFVENFMAAAAAAHALGVSADAMAEAAPRLKPAAHRGQLLRLGQGVVVLDDCYNASPDAVEAAAVALGMAGGRRRVAFLGDMLELGAQGPALHRRVGQEVATRVDVLATAGPLAAAFLEGARAGLPATALHSFPDSAAAARGAGELVRAGDAVLVKGSRGARMEVVVEALKSRFGLLEG
jgi:UDP-N-acetylmuramoyl-tripeptide--D-alanyl-D-alanine ligase